MLYDGHESEWQANIDKGESTKGAKGGGQHKLVGGCKLFPVHFK
jgi:hypothetical protein